MKESHCFIICAYQKSPYLEKCIESIEKQEVKSKIIMCTSTPNSYIKNMAEKHNIELIINNNKGDIESDWNFAYNSCEEQYITLVHQDDVYENTYSKQLFKAISKYEDISIFYSNYRALITTNTEETIKKDINCTLRNLLCFPMRFSCLQTRKWWKKLVLRFGNSICCSSVTYNKAMLGENDIFTSELRYSLDWDTYWKFANQKGRFYYDKSVLNYFRIHQLSTSMLCIENNSREKEDYIMFYKMWPRCVADFIMHFYKLAYCNYKKIK